MSCGIAHRCSSDLALLWLWCRPAAAARLQPLAWELSYAAGVAQKRPKKKKIAEISLCLLGITEDTKMSETILAIKKDAE